MRKINTTKTKRDKENINKKNNIDLQLYITHTEPTTTNYYYFLSAIPTRPTRNDSACSFSFSFLFYLPFCMILLCEGKERKGGEREGKRKRKKGVVGGAQLVFIGFQLGLANADFKWAVGAWCPRTFKKK